MYGLLQEIDSDLIEPQRLAGSVIDQIIVQRKRGATGRLISPFEALKAIAFEAEFVRVCAENLSVGMILAPSDLQRLRVAHQRIDDIVREAIST